MKRIIGTSAFKNGFLGEDRFLISLILLFGMGLLAGSVAVSSSGEYLKDIWQGYVIRCKSQKIVSLFFDSFFSLGFVIVINYVLGHCAIGKPFLYVVMLLYSVGKGVMFSSFYMEYGFIGVLKTILLFGTQNCLMALLLVISSKTSAEHAKQIFDFGYKGKENALNLRKYNGKYAIYGLIAAVLCFIDAVLTSKISFITG